MFKHLNQKQLQTGGSVGVVIALALFLGVCSYQENRLPASPDEKLRIEQGVDIDTKDEEKEEHTEIPVFKAVTVSSDKPNLYLGNPEINDVYFRYKVQVKETSESNAIVLYDNDAVVEPGRAFQVDVRKQLDPGEYTIVVDIATFDRDTEEPCNGATQEAKLIVNE